MKVSNVTVRRRLFIVLILAGVSFLALCVRLSFVQLWQGEQLADKAEDSWRRNIPYVAKRGEIVDRNGIQLAYNVSSPTVYAIPVQIKDQQAAAAALAPLLDMSQETLYKKLKHER